MFLALLCFSLSVTCRLISIPVILGIGDLGRFPAGRKKNAAHPTFSRTESPAAKLCSLSALGMGKNGHLIRHLLLIVLQSIRQSCSAISSIMLREKIILSFFVLNTAI